MTARERGRHSGARVPGAAGLAVRQVLADPWVSVLMAAVVLVVTVVAVLTPRVMDDMNARQVAHVLSPLSAQQRDLVAVASLSGTAVEFGPPRPAEEVWGSLQEAVRGLPASQPEPLRSLLRPGYFYGEMQAPYAFPPVVEDYARAQAQLRVAPDLEERVSLVEGDWPSPCFPLNEEFYRFGDEVPDLGECNGTEAYEVLVSAEAADRLQWEVGEQRGPLLLAGTFAPVDPDDSYWDHAPNALSVGELFDGNIGTQAFVAAYLSPANPGTDGDPGHIMEYRFVLPVEPGSLGGGDVITAAQQLRGFTSGPVVLREQDPDAGSVGTIGQVPVRTDLSPTFGAEVIPVLERLAEEQRTTASVFAVLASGPAGVAAAVLALAARLVVTRRSGSLGLALARGASYAQLRVLALVEGLVVGLPAAALGWWLAGLVRDNRTGVGEYLLAGIVGLVPAAALVLSVGSVRFLERRADLGVRSGSRLRWIGELAVLALAAVAVWQLLGRGGRGDGAQALDPLLVATPVLVAVAAALLTLRVYPIPLSGVVAALKRGRGLTGFLGAARSVRDPSGGLLPALAVVLGFSVAVFSLVMSSTVTRGAETAAWEATGAQVRVTGPTADDALVEQLRSVPGVAEVGRATVLASNVNLTGAVRADGVRVVVVDASLREIQQAAGQLTPLPAELVSDEVPVPVLTGGSAPQGSGLAEVSGGGEVRVVGHVDLVPGLSTPHPFIVVTAEGWERLGHSVQPGNLALLSVEDGADRAEVADAVLEALGGFALVETPDAELDTYRSSPVTSGLTRASITAVALATALTGLALVLVQLITAPARARLIAVLRTLGLAPRQGRALSLWELGPLVLAAAVVGALVGVLVPWLLSHAVDLRSMTGGTRQPDLTVDPLLFGGVIATMLLILLATSLVAAGLAARSDIARQLRSGEER